MNTIRIGSAGPDVSTWQGVLNAGSRPGTWTNARGVTRSWPSTWAWPLAVDGDFGQRTGWATEAWQAARGLVADAVVGPATWSKAGIAAPAPPTGIAFTEATYFSRANRKPESVTLFVVHTAECAEVASAAENLAAWGARADTRKASWHYAIDSDSVTQSVRDHDVAWHAGPVNGFSLGFELAGRASQDAAGWADAYSTAVLDRAAKLIAQKIHNEYPHVPVRRLTAAELAAGERSGICGHVDVTNGLQGGKGHVDPGPAFPWESFLDRIRARLAALEAQGVDTVPEPPPFVPVEHAGVTWLVSPLYVAPVSLSEAADRAAQLGCELPSPGLVDAIWRAADLRVPPHLMIRSHDGTPKTMDADDVHADQARRLEAFIGPRSLGRDFRLLAGAYKDVVSHGGKVGLYGWHVADEYVDTMTRLGIGLSACATPGPGRVVQPIYAGHWLGHRDYSQGLRLCKRA